jgi:2-(1,2-epoxy-1,2-dihydrophenyl)acetyl-CoA isomerase
VSEIRELVARAYTALAAGDGAALAELLAPGFEGHLAEGLPHGIGGPHHGADSMIRDGWWAIGRAYRVGAQPADWIDCVDGRLLVLGRYRGETVDAAFAHLWTAEAGRLTALWQLTDTARWIEHV